MTNVAAAVKPAVPPADDLRPIEPPVRMPGELSWLWWTLAAVVLAGALAGWWFRRRRRESLAAPAPVVPPHLRARQKLSEALLFISEPDRFCTAVSNTLRIYLEERFQLHAPERTTEEFLVELQGSPALNTEQKLSLQHFLQSCDLVKFAKLEPTETTLRELHDAALRLVDETQFEAVRPTDRTEPTDRTDPTDPQPTPAPPRGPE